MEATIPPNFTGRSGAVFYVNGTPTRRIVEVCEGLGLVKFPTYAHRAYCLGRGPKPLSAFDSLPEEAEAAQ